MKSVRERFEEIWPVPRGCMWTDENGYMPIDQDADHLVDRCIEHDARLDTFTRCQETTDIYISLIEEMVDELSQQAYPGDWYYRAKQIMEQIK